MKRIITITFNPCLDKSTTVPLMIPESKMHCTQPKFEPGGGGINVARALKRLGGEALAMFPAGGYSGKFLKSLLVKEEVAVSVIEAETHTRENMIVRELSTNKQYRFGMPGSPLAADIWKRCLSRIERLDGFEYMVASGSLPPGVPTDIFARLAHVAKSKRARLIVDTSGDALKLAIDEGVYLVKPNLKELGFLVGNDNISIEDVYDNASKILHHGKNQVIVVSLGARGAIAVTAGTAFQAIPPAVDIQSTVGSGDSMVAGIVLSLSKRKSLQHAVQYGVACGTAATLNPGTELCKARDVEKLFAGVQTQVMTSQATM